ncbi:MAG: NADH-quinone oxidoreductase subunit D [Cryobacterium sp.]|nr:NADH-quinone oxidoreductase subunit D [Oligoflexia bacterium]
MLIADRVDAETAYSAELAYSMAVEEVCGIAVPRRAQVIRLILCELGRVGSHLGFLARLALATGFETVSHYILRERELVLDLLELMTGRRFNPNFFRFGGVSADITEGFIERIHEATRLIEIRLREYHALMIENRAFVDRLAWQGVLSADAVQLRGLTGPSARASGVRFDVRKAEPYSGYDQLDFRVPIGSGARGTTGDGFDRVIIRLEEIRESLLLLSHAVDSVPPGEFIGKFPTPDFTVPAGEAYSRVEAPRGLLSCHVVSDGGFHPLRVQWRTPSLVNIEIIPEVLKGVTIQDVPVVLATFDLSIAEVDR